MAEVSVLHSGTVCTDIFRFGRSTPIPRLINDIELCQLVTGQVIEHDDRPMLCRIHFQDILGINMCSSIPTRYCQTVLREMLCGTSHVARLVAGPQDRRQGGNVVAACRTTDEG